MVGPIRRIAPFGRTVQARRGMARPGGGLQPPRRFAFVFEPSPAKPTTSRNRRQAGQWRRVGRESLLVIVKRPIAGRPMRRCFPERPRCGGSAGPEGGGDDGKKRGRRRTSSRRTPRPLPASLRRALKLGAAPGPCSGRLRWRRKRPERKTKFTGPSGTRSSARSRMVRHFGRPVRPALRGPSLEGSSRRIRGRHIGFAGPA